MLTFFFSSILFLAASSDCVILQASEIPPGVVHAPLTSVTTNNTGLRRRQFGSTLTNFQNGLEYLITIGIGTPPQSVTLTFDTGSSDLWVNPECEYGSSPYTCSALPKYKPTSSTTSKDTGLTGSIVYGDGTGSDFEFFTDTITIGAAKVAKQQFGVSTLSRGIDYGLIGVGLGNKFITGRGSYPNIIDEMAMQNVTNSRAFSVNLGSTDATEGSVIFGGIDTAKYSGSLDMLPMVPAAQAPDGYPRYWVSMSSVSWTRPGTTVKTPLLDTPLDVVLDSGTTISLLPLKIVTALATAMGAAAVGDGTYQIACTARNLPGSFAFAFGKTVINISYYQFIREVGGYCYLGFMTTQPDTPPYILGDTFMRSAFVVFDQDNQNFHLAQAADCGTNLVAIGSGPNAVPSLPGICDAASPYSSVHASTLATVASSVSVVAPPPTVQPTPKNSKTTAARRTTPTKTATKRNYFQARAEPTP